MSDALDLIESNRKFRIDQGKLNLASFQAQVDAEVDLLKARADFMLKLQEVVAQQIKNEKEFIQLSWLHLQAKEYRRALAESKRRLATARRRQANLQEALSRASWLASGEALQGNLVPLAWGGFFKLVSNLPFDGRLQLANLPITADIRSGLGFSRPRFPEQRCDDVPEAIKNTLKLWEWARSKSYLPRANSAGQKLLESSLLTLSKRGEEILLSVKAEVTLAEEILRTRREILWKETAPKTNTAIVPPKTAAATVPPKADTSSKPDTAPKKAAAAKKDTAAKDATPMQTKSDSTSSSSTAKGTTKKGKESDSGEPESTP
jgi:hypothetical protein